jgi:branched-subunit amino acid aminotransferase/4-amino-4-deoxychorismate lyase
MTASISIDDPAFRYGHGAFETVRVRDGRAVFAQAHRESLATACAAMALPAPEAAKLNAAPPCAEGLWRWFVTLQGTFTWWDGKALEPLPGNFSLGVSALRVSARAWEARYKTTSYLLHWQARHEAKTDEALLLNEAGDIASASMANIFWIKDGALYTPSPECGCRAGVVRRWVLENAGLPVKQGMWTPMDLMGSEAVFLTNSRLGIMPVREFEGRALDVSSTKLAALRAAFAAAA